MGQNTSKHFSAVLSTLPQKTTFSFYRNMVNWSPSSETVILVKLIAHEIILAFFYLKMLPLCIYIYLLYIVYILPIYKIYIYEKTSISNS